MILDTCLHSEEEPELVGILFEIVYFRIVCALWCHVVRQSDLLGAE